MVAYKSHTPIDETVIYIDTPYFNAAQYAEKMCNNELIEYVKNSHYKIYLSSYEFDLHIVAEFEHRSTLSATSNNKTIERLFCNRPTEYNQEVEANNFRLEA